MCRRARTQEISGEICVEDPLPFFQSNLIKPSQDVRCCVIEQNVDSFRVCSDLGDRRFRRPAVSKVDFPPPRVRANAPQFLHRLVEHRPVAIEEFDVGALASKQECYGTPYAAGGAGLDGHAVFQASHDYSPSFVAGILRQLLLG
jgi:hypothetical protein